MKRFIATTHAPGMEPANLWLHSHGATPTFIHDHGYPLAPECAEETAYHPAEQLAVAGTDLTIPVHLMSKRNGRRKRKYKTSSGGSPRRQRPPQLDLPEERLVHWLGTRFRNIGQWRTLRWIKSLFWENPGLEGSSYKWAVEHGLTQSPGRGFAMHGKGKALTEMIIAAIRPSIGRGWDDGEHPMIVELGAGCGELARIVAETTGAAVLEVDLMEGIRPNPMRMIGDIANLELQSNRYGVVVSSYAAEYERPESFQEAFRILRPGGRLVALVHHRNSAIAHNNWVVRSWGALLKSAYLFMTGFKPIRFFIPKIVRGLWGGLARQGYDLQAAAFENRKEAQRLLTEVGFVDIDIETARASGIFGGKGKNLKNLGWLITARKPGKRKARSRK